MNTAQMIPRESDKRVQDILNDHFMDLEDRAKMIYLHDDSCLSREYDRKKPKPEMTERQIFDVLVDRCR